MTHRIGDVLRAKHSAWPEGSFIQGPVFMFGTHLSVAGFSIDGIENLRELWTVEVIETKHAYVNVDRDPVPGDIVRDADDADDTATYSPADRRTNSDDTWWENRTGSTLSRDELPDRLRLLVDGETGQVVS